MPLAHHEPRAETGWDALTATVFESPTVERHLEHAAAHRPTVLLIRTMIRVLAYALSVLLCPRQVLSHAGQGRPTSFGDWAQPLRQPAPALDCA